MEGRVSIRPTEKHVDDAMTEWAHRVEGLARQVQTLCIEVQGRPGRYTRVETVASLLQKMDYETLGLLAKIGLGGSAE